MSGKGLIALFTAALALGACETGTELGLDARADVSFQVQDGGGLFGGSPPNEVHSGGEVIIVTQATVTATSIALKGTGASEQSGDVTFDLPVRGGMVTPSRMGVESGVFTRLELVVRSIRLRGTHDGQPFDVTVRTDAATELALFPPVTVHEGDHSNVTVRVELREWFRSESGGLMEPARLQADTSLQARLGANIARSLQAFLDLNADGQAG